MKDLIERQAAIDAINGVLVEDDACKVWFKLAVKNLPSAQPYTDEEIQKIQDLEQAQLDKAYEMGKADALQWIQCSERLPEDFQSFYATCRSNIDNRENWVIEGYYTPWRGFNPPPLVAEGKAEIIAWMPKELPEPYKEEDDK